MEEDSIIQAFAQIAAEYCSWVEGPAEDSSVEIATVQRLLADLHAGVIRLTDIGCGEEESVDEVSADEWKIVRERFSKLPVNGYWHVFDPLELDAPVFSVLSDDLADIYGNVKEGLRYYEKGLVTEAVWEWRFTFSTHWGRHLLGAQQAIHSYLGNC